MGDESASLLVQVLGHSDTLAYEAWPSYNEKLLVSDTFNLPIQVMPCVPHPLQYFACRAPDPLCNVFLKKHWPEHKPIVDCVRPANRKCA